MDSTADTRPDPDVLILVMDTFNDLMANIGGYAMVSLGYSVVALPIGMVLGCAGALGMYATLFGGMMVTVASLGFSGGGNPDDSAALFAVLGSFGSMAAGMVVMFGFMTLLNMALAPLTSGFYRAVAAHQRGEGGLDFGASFRHARTRIGAAIAVSFFVLGAQFLGMAFCFVGTFFAAFLFATAPALCSIHRVSAMTAMRMSAAHVRARPMVHLAFFVVFFTTAMFAAYVPVLGTAFIVALQVRAVRAFFGDAPAAAAAVAVG